MANNKNMNAAATNNNSFDDVRQAAGKVWESVKAGYSTVNRERSRVQAEVEGDVETLKGGFAAISNILSDTLGLNNLANSVNIIIEAGMNAGDRGSIEAMAKEVRNQVSDQIARLKKRGTQSALKDAMALKEIIGEDGEELPNQGILGSLCAGLIWIARRISALMKEWFGFDYEKAPAILKLICSAVKAIFGFIRSGVRIVITVVGTALSWVAAGVIKLAAWIVNTAKALFTKAKDFIATHKVGEFNAATVAEQ